MKRFLLLLLIPATSCATTYPGFRDMISDSSVYSEPQVGKPAYLASMPDSIFRTPFRRIAGDPGAPIPLGPGPSKTWGSDVRHVYSKQEPWNSDQSWVLIENRSGGTPSKLTLDGETFLPVQRMGCGSFAPWDFRWHPSRAHPHEQINVSQDGRTLEWFDVLDCRQTRAWALPLAVDGFGKGEGNPSNDGRFVALSSGSSVFVVDMDPQPPYAPYPNVRVGPILTLLTSLPAPPDTIGNVSISPLGDYVDVKYADKIYRGGSTDSLVTADAHRILGVDPGTLALSAHPMSPGTVCDPGGAYASLFPPSQGWIFPLKHADMGLTETGEEVIVGGRACVGGPDIGRVTMVKLGDGTVLGLTNPENEASVGWVSMRNLDRPGWAYVTYMNNPSQIGKRYWDEVISVKTDGSRALQRWGHTHSDYAGCYRCEPHAVPSRDGTRVLVASDWAKNCAAGCGSQSVRQGYVFDGRPTRTVGPASRQIDLDRPTGSDGRN